MAFRTLSLCSGIGGLDLGVELAFPGSRVVGYVEREAFPASVLLARMEDETLERAPVWCGDLRDLDARPLRGHADLVTAGYPCQPFSVAGSRRGDQDERHLWPEVARIIGEVGPSYVLLENVPGHLRLGFDAVLGDLADLGFHAEWTVVGAGDVGAPHRRKRLFVLAHRERNALRHEQGRQRPERPEGLEQERSGEALAGHTGEGLAHRDSGGREGVGLAGATGEQRARREEPDRCRGAGLADAEGSGRSSEGKRGGPQLTGVRPDGEGLADAEGTRLEERGRAAETGLPRPARPGAAVGDSADDHRGTGERGPEAGTRADLERGRGSPGPESRPLWPPGPSPDLWGAIGPAFQPALHAMATGDAALLLASRPPEAESGLRRVVDGASRRVERSRLASLGNGVVPLAAAHALRILWRRLND